MRGGTRLRKGVRRVTLRHMDLPLRKLVDIPPVWLLLTLGLVWLQGSYLPVGPAPGPAMRLLGAGLIAAAVVLIVLAARELRRHRTSVVPHMEPTAIVTTGVFAWSRNPIYLADALIIAGFALRWHAYPSLVLVPLFMVFVNARFVRGEEARLAAAFAEEFGAYARKVRRWL